MNELEKFRAREFRGVEELAAAAGSLIEQYTKEPARGNVRLGITERIVRHYLSEGLLGPPSGHSGPAILFNYGNLLRLLAVKKLLADRWSVVKIREFMSSLDITALEQLVTTALTPINPKQKKFDNEKRDVASLRATQRLQQSAAGREETPPPSMTLATTPPLASLAVESARRAERASAEWIELATGLEIKIRRSFRPPRNERERERLIKRFWSMIEKQESGARSQKPE
ncbi:MAG TPA: MerR family transcriptional regulator [Pyrinomonadaceae bacterium]|nr:MerR family transcriptional regulator [Pyrinomonadaceae bacterium]